MVFRAKLAILWLGLVVLVKPAFSAGPTEYWTPHSTLVKDKARSPEVFLDSALSELFDLNLISNKIENQNKIPTRIAEDCQYLIKRLPPSKTDMILVQPSSASGVILCRDSNLKIVTVELESFSELNQMERAAFVQQALPLDDYFAYTSNLCSSQEFFDLDLLRCVDKVRKLLESDYYSERQKNGKSSAINGFIANNNDKNLFLVMVRDLKSLIESGISNTGDSSLDSLSAINKKLFQNCLSKKYDFCSKFYGQNLGIEWESTSINKYTVSDAAIVNLLTQASIYLNINAYSEDSIIKVDSLLSKIIPKYRNPTTSNPTFKLASESSSDQPLLSITMTNSDNTEIGSASASVIIPKIPDAPDTGNYLFMYLQSLSNTKNQIFSFHSFDKDTAVEMFGRYFEITLTAPGSPYSSLSSIHCSIQHCKVMKLDSVKVEFFIIAQGPYMLNEFPVPSSQLVTDYNQFKITNGFETALVNYIDRDDADIGLLISMWLDLKQYVIDEQGSDSGFQLPLQNSLLLLAANHKNVVTPGLACDIFGHLWITNEYIPSDIYDDAINNAMTLAGLYLDRFGFSDQAVKNVDRELSRFSKFYADQHLEYAGEPIELTVTIDITNIRLFKTKVKYDSFQQDYLSNRGVKIGGTWPFTSEIYLLSYLIIEIENVKLATNQIGFHVFLSGTAKPDDDAFITDEKEQEITTTKLGLTIRVTKNYGTDFACSNYQCASDSAQVDGKFTFTTNSLGIGLVILSCSSNQYFDLSSKACLYKCSTPCDTCDGQGICSKCLGDFALTQGQCYYCNVQNCLACSADYECGTCKSGYYVDAKLTCVVCLTLCNTCSDGNTCIDCKENAEKDNNNQCSCKASFGLKTGDSICETCKQPNCLECPADSTKCSKCKDGFFNDADKCTSCPNLCNTCTDKSTCFTCKADSALDPTKMCQCNEGYFADVDKCSSCPVICKACSSFTTCSTCQSTATLDATKMCRCDSGQRFNTPTKVCEICTQLNCLECLDNASECTKCKVGYSLNSDKCDLCPSLCTACSSSTTCSTCKTNAELGVSNMCKCKVGYYLSSDKCDLCPSLCTACSSSTTCSTCKTNAELDVSKMCKCKVGYGYKSDELSCVSCKQSLCLECSADYSLCTKCEDAFFSDKGICKCLEKTFQISSNKCQACPSECKTCTSLTNCLSCINLALLDSNTNVCKCDKNSNYNSTVGACVCSKKFLLSNEMTCLPCNSYITQDEVKSFSYSSDFKYLIIQFSVQMEPVSSCSDVSLNSSLFGTGAQCSASTTDKSIIVTLGTGWTPLTKISLEPKLTKVDPSDKSCVFNLSDSLVVNANLTGLVYFKGGKIDSISEIYTGCKTLGKIRATLNDLIDLTGLGVNYTWSINTNNSVDSKVNDQIKNTNSDNVLIDVNSYTSLQGNGTLEVMVSNKFNVNYTVSLGIQLLMIKKITIAIDGDSEVSVSTDSNLKFSAIVLNNCDINTTEPIFTWKFDGEEKDKPNITTKENSLLINKGELFADKTYKFSVTADIENLKSNTAKLNLNIILKDIIIDLKAPVLAAVGTMLTFDANSTKDPNNYSNGTKISYEWSCPASTDLCKDFNKKIGKSDESKISYNLTSNFKQNSFIISVKVSSRNLTAIKQANVSIGNLSVSMNIPSKRVPFSKFNFIFGESSAEEQGRASYKWSLTSVDKNKYIGSYLFLITYPFAFSSGKSYNYSLAITVADNKKQYLVVGSLAANNAPSCEKYSISSRNGKAFTDVFTMSATCTDVEEDYPLYAVVSFAFNNRKDWTSDLKSSTNIKSCQSRMPLGTIVIVYKVCDNMDDCISYNFPIVTKNSRQLLSESQEDTYKNLVIQDPSSVPGLCTILASSYDLDSEFWRQVLEDLNIYLRNSSEYYTSAEINSTVSCLYWLHSDKQVNFSSSDLEASYYVISKLFEKFPDVYDQNGTFLFEDYHYNVFMKISDAFLNYIQETQIETEVFIDILEKAKSIQLQAYDKYFYLKTSGLQQTFIGANFKTFKRIINYFDENERMVDLTLLNDNTTQVNLQDSLEDNKTQVGVLITSFNNLGNYTKFAEAVEVKLTKQGIIENDSFKFSEDPDIQLTEETPIFIKIKTFEEINTDDHACGFWDSTGEFITNYCELTEISNQTATLKVSHLSFYGIIEKNYDSCEVNHAPIIIMAVTGFIMVILIPLMVILDNVNEISEEGENLNQENGVSRTIEYSPRSPASLTERPLASISSLSIPDVEDISESIIENPNAADYTIEFKLRPIYDEVVKKVEKVEKNCCSKMIEGHLLFGLHVRRSVFLRPFRVLTLFSTLILQLFLEGIFLFYAYGTDDSETGKNDERSTQTLFDDYKSDYFGYCLVAVAIAVPFEILLIFLFSKDWNKSLLRTLGILLIVVVVGGSIAGIIILTLDFCFKWSGYWAISFLWSVLIEIFFLQFVYMFGRYLVKTEDK